MKVVMCMSRIEIKIGGFGGQGVILGGLILARALSIYEGKHAAFTQEYGAEARGGSSASAVVVDDERVDYPYPVNPDILVLMSQGAMKSYLSSIKKGGMLITEKDLVKIEKMPEEVAEFHSIPATRLAEEIIHNKIVTNIIMVGFIAKVTGLVSKENVKRSVLEMVPARVRDMNEKAFEIGYNYDEGAE